MIGMPIISPPIGFKQRPLEHAGVTCTYALYIHTYVIQIHEYIIIHIYTYKLLQTYVLYIYIYIYIWYFQWAHSNKISLSKANPCLVQLHLRRHRETAQQCANHFRGRDLRWKFCRRGNPLKTRTAWGMLKGFLYPILRKGPGGSMVARLKLKGIDGRDVHGT